MNSIMLHDLASRVFSPLSAGETCGRETHELHRTASGGLHPQLALMKGDDPGV
jgi:hypothetical protein